MSDLFASPVDVSPVDVVVATGISPKDTLRFSCPRCGLSVVEMFYGPCSVCVGELRSKIGLDRKEVGIADYEPKMNVTPNAVASKE